MREELLTPGPTPIAGHTYQAMSEGILVIEHSVSRTYQLVFKIV